MVGEAHKVPEAARGMVGAACGAGTGSGNAATGAGASGWGAAAVPCGAVPSTVESSTLSLLFAVATASVCPHCVQNRAALDSVAPQ